MAEIGLPNPPHFKTRNGEGEAVVRETAGSETTAEQVKYRYNCQSGLIDDGIRERWK
jgi:hypothetical protein